MKKRMKESKKMCGKRWCAALLALLLSSSLTACGMSEKSESAAADMMAEEAVEFDVTEEESAAGALTEDGMSDTTSAGVAKEGGAEQTSEKIIYTYNYSVETKQYDELMDELQQRVTEYGGYVESAETNGNAQMNIRRYSNMVIRIPADRMHSFLDMVKEKSNVTYSSSSSENVTLNYVDLQSHIKALKVEQETLMDILEKAEKLEDIITIQSQLTTVRYELESYESQLRVFDNRINYSTLYLDITEVERETNVATELSYMEEIKQGLSDTFYNIGHGLRTFSIWFIVNLPVLLLWALIIFVIFMIVRKVANIRNKKRVAREAKKQTGIWSAQNDVKEKETGVTDEEKN